MNTSCTVDHDSVIKDFVHLSPGVNIAGTVKIGEKTWLGIGATVKNNVSIVENCIIGASTLLRKDIQEEGRYVGNPIKKIH